MRHEVPIKTGGKGQGILMPASGEKMHSHQKQTKNVQQGETCFFFINMVRCVQSLRTSLENYIICGGVGCLHVGLSS